jgi:hypothetical protein
MKHVTKYGEWQSVNESITLVTLQIAVILGIIGFRGLRALIKKVAGDIGMNAELEKAELKKLVDEIMSDIQAKNESGISIGQVTKDVKSKIDAGEIKTLGQLQKYFNQV